MSTSTDGRRHAAWLFDPQDLICKDGEDNTWDCTYVDASLVDTVYIYEYNRASKSAYWWPVVVLPKHRVTHKAIMGHVGGIPGDNEALAAKIFTASSSSQSKAFTPL